VDRGGHRDPVHERGQLAVQRRLTDSAGEVEQDRVAGAAGDDQPLVGGELRGDDGNVFGAAVVFEEEPHGTAVGLPDAVPVGVDGGQGVDGGGVGLAPPAGQPGVRVGAGVTGEGGEEVVDAEQVVEFRV